MWAWLAIWVELRRHAAEIRSLESMSDARADDELAGAQLPSQSSGCQGSMRSFPKWMWVRGLTGVPLSQTARKSPGATSISVG